VRQEFEILAPFLKVFQRASSTDIYEQLVLNADHMVGGKLSLNAVNRGNPCKNN
jgi:hypothetical protein